MLPNLGIFETYSILLLLGVLACFVLLYLYAKKYQFSKNYLLSILMLACASIVLGLVFATGAQWVLDTLDKDNTNTELAMTFYGGLLGGAAFFILVYFLGLKKKYKEASFRAILTIAPACITIAHSFGRVGCFCAGCCYGKETTSALGVQFPNLSNPVYPTQLYEAIFLALLTLVLFYLAYKKNFKYTMSVYMMSYGVFRFLLEFIRGDERGVFVLGLSPSQWVSIFLIIGSIVLYFVLNKYNEKEKASV